MVFVMENELEKVEEEQNETKPEKKSESFKTYIKHMFSLKEDTASNEEIRTRLLDGGKVTGTNMCVLICAMVIASVGLNTGSTAVIIGAMLISPLMGSLLAMAYGTVANNGALTGKHFVGLLTQIGFSLLASTIYFLLSPIKEPTSELLARTSPTFFDVLIAVFGGTAGIIGQTRKDKANNIIPGVAIATALMPPVCTCGYALANWKPQMLVMAAYLFLVNAYFIFLSASVVLMLLKIPKEKEMTPEEWKKMRRRMLRNTLLIIIPSIYLLVRMVMGK